MENNLGTQTALFSLVIFLSTMVAPCLGGPVRSKDLGEEPWWHNPCSVSHTRHSSGGCSSATTTGKPSRFLQSVKWQMRNVFNSLKTKMNDIDKLYADVKRVNPNQFEYRKWLPKFTSIEQYRDNPAEVLPTLHEQIQKYAVTFQELSLVRVNTDIPFDMEKRAKVLRDTGLQLRTLLCEVETAINNTCVRSNLNLINSDFVEHRLKSRSDLTEMHIQDWGVLSAYKKFLSDWTRNIRKLTVKKNKNKNKNKSKNRSVNRSTNKSKSTKRKGKKP